MISTIDNDEILNETKLVSTILEGFSGGSKSVLIVHASFTNYSRAGLEANKFCDALISTINGGTLLMPTMSWRTITPSSPVFNELKTPSHTGILSENFRLNFATNRSLHPTHSVAGKGPLAQYLLSSHHFGTTPCPSSSPYGLMRDYDSHVLFLGDIGLEVCTAIHHCEEVIAPEVYLLPYSPNEKYKLYNRSGNTYDIEIRRHKKLDRDFNKFEDELKIKKGLKRGESSNLSWMVVSLKKLYRIVFHRLSLNPYATLRCDD